MKWFVIDHEFTKNYLFQQQKKNSGRELWVLRVTADIDNVPIMRPRVKWVANMHGDESVGRELTIQMAQYLTQNYQTNSTVLSFLQKTDITEGLN